MNIIRQTAAPAQCTTTYKLEERTIDVHAGQRQDLIANPDLLVNPTTGTTRVLTAHGIDDAWNLLRTQLAQNPDRYKPGKGYRLVLVEVKGGGR